jgi:UDP-glucose 4-epimerase
MDLVKDVDAVLHHAALVSITESIRNPILVNDVNVNGTLNLLKASVDSRVRRFIYASSAAVYGNPEALPVKENCSLKPISPYGASKLAAENYVNVFNQVFGIETVCLRYFNVYGPRQAFGDYAGVITKFVNSLAKDLPLVIFGDGKQTRDFVHVQDVVEANILALDNKEVSGETFNVGTGVATTLNQLATMLLRAANKNSLKLRHTEPRRGDIQSSVADISEARKRLSYKPIIQLKSGLEELVKLGLRKDEHG